MDLCRAAAVREDIAVAQLDERQLTVVAVSAEILDRVSKRPPLAFPT
jgi:hypothetical protein